MRYSNSSLALATALLLVGFGGANATAQPSKHQPANHLLTNRLLTRYLVRRATSLEFRQAPTRRVWYRAKPNRMSPPWAPVVSSFPVQIRRIRAVPASKVVLKAKARRIRIQPLATPHLSSGGTGRAVELTAQA